MCSPASHGFYDASIHPSAKRIAPAHDTDGGLIAAVEVKGTVFFNTTPPTHPANAIAAANHRRSLTS